MKTGTGQRPHIAYVGPFSFPAGGAAARRILGNVQALQNADYQVSIGSGQIRDSQEDYQGIPVHSIGERTAEQLPSALKRFFYGSMGRKTCNWLDGLRPRPMAVILYSGYAPYFLRLLPWCKRRGVPLIFDAVEWYDPPSIWSGLVSPYQWNIEMAMRYLAPKADGIIAISSFLQNHFERKGSVTVRVPPTLDTAAVEPNLETRGDGHLVISYTGNPALKDLFDDYLESALNLDSAGHHIRLVVAGVSRDKLISFPAIRKRGLSSLPDCVETLGIVPQAEAMALVRRSDFSVLTRPRARNTEAGFPTKAVESLAVGTPVILNITSDLGEYIHDGREGIICSDHRLDSLMSAIERALSMTSKETAFMRREARRRAEESFDYRNYTGVLGEFIEKVRN